MSVALVRDLSADTAIEQSKASLPADAASAVPAAANSSATSSLHASAATSGTQAPPDPTAKRAYRAPADVPTQQGPDGLRFDFNYGLRLLLPAERASLASVRDRSRYRQYSIQG